jgi:hypothetical protein
VHLLIAAFFVVIYDVGSRKNNIQKDGPFLERVFRLNLP